MYFIVTCLRQYKLICIGLLVGIISCQQSDHNTENSDDKDTMTLNHNSKDFFYLYFLRYTLDSTEVDSIMKERYPRYFKQKKTPSDSNQYFELKRLAIRKALIKDSVPLEYLKHDKEHKFIVKRYNTYSSVKAYLDSFVFSNYILHAPTPRVILYTKNDTLLDLQQKEINIPEENYYILKIPPSKVVFFSMEGYYSKHKC